MCGLQKEKDKLIGLGYYLLVFSVQHELVAVQRAVTRIWLEGGGSLPSYSSSSLPLEQLPRNRQWLWRVGVSVTVKRVSILSGWAFCELSFLNHLFSSIQKPSFSRCQFGNFVGVFSLYRRIYNRTAHQNDSHIKILKKFRPKKNIKKIM